MVVLGIRWSVREPDYEGATSGGPDWSAPTLGDVGGDLTEFGKLHIFSSSGFPPEIAGDCKFPVVSPRSGNLRYDALESAWRMSGHAHVPGEAEREIREMIRRLVSREFEDTDLHDRIREYFEER